jgi:hypothetical protein
VEEQEAEEEEAEEEESEEDVAQVRSDPVNQDKMPTTPAAPKRSAKSSAKKRVVAVITNVGRTLPARSPTSMSWPITSMRRPSCRTWSCWLHDVL